MVAVKIPGRRFSDLFHDENQLWTGRKLIVTRLLICQIREQSASDSFINRSMEEILLRRLPTIPISGESIRQVWETRRTPGAGICKTAPWSGAWNRT